MFLCPKKLMMGVLFMILASSMAFQAVRNVLGGWIATQEGLPKIGGLAVHAVVFMVLSTVIWRYAPFGSSNFEGEDEEYEDEEYEDEDEEYEDEEFRRSKKSRRRSKKKSSSRRR
jgi:hypothetical protein